MQFYEVHEHAHPAYWWAEPDSYEELHKYCNTRRNPPKPLRYVIRHGRRPGHVVGERAWSASLVTALVRSKARGYGKFPIDLWYEDQERVTGYVGMRVFGSGGPFDAERSQAEYGRGDAPISYQAIYMQEALWDGSDIFTIPGLGYSAFVVERVADELRKLKLKNVSLVKNTECSLP